jgi:hypothetical protein
MSKRQWVFHKIKIQSIILKSAHTSLLSTTSTNAQNDACGKTVDLVAHDLGDKARFVRFP